MKKIVLAFAIFTLSLSAVFAQVGTDPTDDFYKQIERWEIMGIIKEQLPLRPYPVQIVERILQDVIEGENETEAELASETYERIFNRSFKIRAEGQGNLKFNSDDKEKNRKQIVGLVGLDGDYKFSDLVAASYKLGVLGTTDSDQEALPLFSAQPYYFRDPVDLSKIQAYLEMDANFAIATDYLFAQAGVNHNSFGPFYDDSAIISPDAKHTANFTFGYTGRYFTYTQAFFGLSASTPDSSEDDLFSKKFLSLHSINGKIFDWLTASLYESVIYGDRFEPAYLIPVPYMVIQGLSGFDDNVFMGLSFTVRPVNDFVWINDFYVDDLGVNKLVKLDFDAKIRGTYQTAFKYSPSNVSWLDLVNLNYTIVTPYMYTHWQNVTDTKTSKTTLGTLSTVNYQEYTTAGLPLGLSLPPNTEKVGLSVELKPVKNFSLKLSGAYMRHANVNENLPFDEQYSYLTTAKGKLATDGSLHNHAEYYEGVRDGEGREKYEKDYLPSAKQHFLFLEQDTQMHVFQGGVNAEYILPTQKFGRFSLGVGYSFEYIHNYGVDKNIFNAGVKVPGGTTYDFENKVFVFKTTEDKEAAKKQVADAIQNWKNNLTDVTNNYVTVYFKYTW